LLKRPWFRRIWVSGKTTTIWAEVINTVYSGPSRGCRSSTCPDQVWSCGDRRICVLLRNKRIETLSVPPMAAGSGPPSDRSYTKRNIPT
jgi:hypothetical protein